MYTHFDRTRDVVTAKANRTTVRKSAVDTQVNKSLTADDFLTEAEYRASQKPKILTCFRTGKPYRKYPCGKTEYI